MRAFARPDVSQGQWWRDLGPMLTPTARETYRYVQVEQVPASKVRGSGELVSDDTPFLARVEVRTDVGRYTVLLSRSAQDGPWLAERIEPKRSAQ